MAFSLRSVASWYQEFRRSLFGRISLVFFGLLIIAAIIDLTMWLFLWARYTDYSEQFVSWQLARTVEQELRTELAPPVDSVALRSKLLKILQINPRIDIFVLDAEGTILASVGETLRQKVDVEPIKEFVSRRRLKDHPLYGDDPFHPATSPLRSTVVFSAAETMIGDQPGYIYVTLRGQSYRHVFSVIGEQDLLRAILVWIAITIAVVASLGIALFRAITRRFSKLTSTVERFAAGDYQRRVDKMDNDEIGALADTFNTMAATIQSNIQALEENDQLRRNLVANVSHDLRGPLTCVHGFLQMLELEYGEKFEHDAGRYLEVIEKNIGHLRKLADSLFELSKLEAQETAPARERFSLEELCADVLMKHRPLAQERSIALSVEAGEELADVVADIMLIERVLTNLVDNALRYTPAGGSITIRLAAAEGMVSVAVEDTGKGIPKEDLPYLFERFYRVEKHRSKKEGGSGLGLAIVKRILEAHGADITVESTLGEGSVFRFSLATVPNGGSVPSAVDGRANAAG